MKVLFMKNVAFCALFSVTSAFTLHNNIRKIPSSFLSTNINHFHRQSKITSCEIGRGNVWDEKDNIKAYDPLELSSQESWSHCIGTTKSTHNYKKQISTNESIQNMKSQEYSRSSYNIQGVTTTAATTASTLLLLSTPLQKANAAISTTNAALLNSEQFNPDSFRPVCPASDSFYRIFQTTTRSVVGDDNFIEYGPLIAGGLLRVRLELCVVESFFNEAVGPFIAREGLSWVLPLHETVESFLAGSIFAFATTFILVGSTKIVSVIFTYGDVFIGLPLRILGGFAFDRARGKPVTLDIGFGPFKTRVIGPKDGADMNKKKADGDFSSLDEILAEYDISGVETKDLPVVLLSGSFKVVGETSKVARDLLEGLDLFVGRYLTLLATGYIGIKFLHYKVFPDFPPF